jgi:glycosyltransferase involved in cell wall biosynthesis
MTRRATAPEPDEDLPMAVAVTGAAPVVSVIIPTFHRPEGALAAVRSVFAQIDAPSYEIILVDNDGEGSARAVAEELARDAPAPLRYAIEPKAGVANARNTAVTMARGAFIAFLDDDEVAWPRWLASLLDAQRETGADVTFGPIEARLPAKTEAPRSHFQTFFSRTLDGGARLIDKPYGCGNSLLRRETVITSARPFDVATNETGGEDDLLWHDVAARGGRFAWAPDAWVYEDVPAKRGKWAYLTRRAFAYGHFTSAQWFETGKVDLMRGVGSMARGLAQTLLMAPVAAALWLVGDERYAWAYDKIWRGLGKVLWFGPFKQSFYGAAAKPKPKRPRR